MKSRLQLLIKATAIVLMFCGLSLLPLQGAVLYTLDESFSSPHDGLPTGWVAVSGGAGTSTIAVKEIPSKGWRLQLKRDGATSSIPNLFFTGTEGSIVNGVVSDFSSSVIISATGGTTTNFTRGVVGRVASASSSISGYYAYVKSDSIYISLNASTTVSLKEAALTETLLANIDYEFHFSAIGDVLSASILKRDDEGNFTITLGSISVTDSTYTSGLFGFRAMPDGSGRYATYRDLTLNVIPEPSLVWMGLGLLGWFGWSKGRKN